MDHNIREDNSPEHEFQDDAKEQSAEMLLALKQTPTSSPSSPTSPIGSELDSGSDDMENVAINDACPLKNCIVCQREQPYCLIRSPTWPAIMRVVFYALKHNRPDREFFNLKDDVYKFMLAHWNKLSIHKKTSPLGNQNWKKQLQDMLSHSKELFESGADLYGQNGFWRLKVFTDPWTLTGKPKRKKFKDMVGASIKREREEDVCVDNKKIRQEGSPARSLGTGYLVLNVHHNFETFLPPAPTNVSTRPVASLSVATTAIAPAVSNKNAPTVYSDHTIRWGQHMGVNGLSISPSYAIEHPADNSMRRQSVDLNTPQAPPKLPEHFDKLCSKFVNFSEEVRRQVLPQHCVPVASGQLERGQLSFLLN